MFEYIPIGVIKHSLFYTFLMHRVKWIIGIPDKLAIEQGVDLLFGRIIKIFAIVLVKMLEI